MVEYKGGEGACPSVQYIGYGKVTIRVLSQGKVFTVSSVWCQEVHACLVTGCVGLIPYGSTILGVNSFEWKFQTQWFELHANYEQNFGACPFIEGACPNYSDFRFMF